MHDLPDTVNIVAFLASALGSILQALTAEGAALGAPGYDFGPVYGSSFLFARVLALYQSGGHDNMLVLLAVISVCVQNLVLAHMIAGMCTGT